MRRVKSVLLVAVALGFCGLVPQKAAAQCGIASWYGGKFHGRRTANGEVYNMHGVSAAHKGLRFGTRVRVTNRKTGRSIVVRINDRGPFIKGRIIDLSGGARQALGMGGLASVCLDVVSAGSGKRVRPRHAAKKAGKKVVRVASNTKRRSKSRYSSRRAAPKVIRVTNKAGRRAKPRYASKRQGLKKVRSAQVRGSGREL